MKLVIPAVALVFAFTAGEVFAQSTELRHFKDASLYGVQFVGDGEGWAVGDEGVIWHTVNGGKDWLRVPSGTRASLRSICFITPRIGWIAGRQELPKGGSVGVVLFTADGGLNWNQGLTNALPGLNRVRFIDGKTGFLMGDGTEEVPSGLFKTTDGGRNWKPVPGDRVPTWFDGDFADGDVGALAGAWSRLAKLRLGHVTAADVDALGGRAVRGLRMMADRALAVGDGGLVLVSKTQGAGWGYVDLKLPADLSPNLDFHAVDSVGDRVWIVGRPGSVILHSKDRGRTWELQKTNQPLPLHSVYFSNERRGYAVGALGTILSTVDGGVTWRLQRSGGRRAALLCVHADSTALPVETIAEVGLEQGYLTTGLRVCAPDYKSAALVRATASQRFAAAVRLAGGATGEMLWQFPLPQHLACADARRMMEYWDSLHDKQAAQQMLRQLVLAIRIWRPEVLVTDDSDADGPTSQSGSLLADAVKEAIKLAANPKAYPEQIERLHLQPWQTARAYTTSDKKNSPDVIIDANALHSRLQGTPRDYTFPAAALLSAQLPQAPGQRCFRLLVNRIAGLPSKSNLMAGVEARASQGARRSLPPQKEPPAKLVEAVKARKHLQLFAENPTEGLVNPNQVISRLKPVLSQLPDHQGAAAAFALGSHYARSGQWILAQETYLTMAQHYPTHPLTAHAYRWLIQHNTSGEAQRRYELGQFVLTRDATVTPPQMPTPAQMKKILLQKEKNRQHTPDQTQSGAQPNQLQSVEPKKLPVKLKQEDWNKLYQGAKTSSKGQLTFLSDQQHLRKKYDNILDYSKRLQLFGPIYGSDPSVAFCVQAAHRRLGDSKKAHDWYRNYKGKHRPSPWQQAAAAEFWLALRQGVPPKPIITCPAVATRPYLDGEFDDPCWQGVKPVVLEDAIQSTAKGHHTEVRLAHDRDFLYLALRCTHPAEYYAPPARVRPRDDDLTGHDRVSVLLDLDRDYSTYFRFDVDQRGCVYEGCWGDQSWNPRWFVAVRSNKTTWKIEAAIPLSQITGRPITPATVWACNIVRILPQRGVQALSTPADVQPRPEGMGLLLFQAAANANGIQPVSHVMPAAP